VFIDALHNCQMQEPRFEQHDRKMDQTGSEIYILNRGTEVFIDALHNGQMQEPRFKQCDERMDQTRSEIYILDRGTGVYRCFTQLL
jgi:hypothetical protein